MKKSLIAILLLGLLLSACHEQEAGILSEPAVPDESEAVCESVPPTSACPDETEARHETAEPTSGETEPTVQESHGQVETPAEKIPQETVQETVHQHNFTTEVIPATCTEAGFTRHICSCGKSFTDNEVPAAGHRWSDWAVIQEATTGAAGIESRACSVCGASETREIPRLPPEPLDYAAAMAYGNRYAQSAYGALAGDSLSFENAGYYPYAQISLETIGNNGGQTYLNYQVELKVDATYESLEASGGFAGAAIRCDVHEAKYAHEQEGYVYIYIYYG